MAQVAEGTGGEFFHNNNDLKAGFGRLAGSPGAYILAFAPKDLKPDGKFHQLKVTLAEKVRRIASRLVAAISRLGMKLRQRRGPGK